MSLVQLIKQTSMEAFEASKPTTILFGEVVGSLPLQIQINQKLTVSGDFILTTSLCEDLAAGEKVILLRQQGGQKYIVLDRLR